MHTAGQRNDVLIYFLSHNLISLKLFAPILELTPPPLLRWRRKKCVVFIASINIYIFLEKIILEETKMGVYENVPWLFSNYIHITLKFYHFFVDRGGGCWRSATLRYLIWIIYFLLDKLIVDKFQFKDKALRDIKVFYIDVTN